MTVCQLSSMRCVVSVARDQPHLIYEQPVRLEKAILEHQAT